MKVVVLGAGVAGLSSALALARDIGWRVGESYALLALGENLAAEGSFDRAYAALRDSLAIAEAVGHQQWMVSAHWGLGLLYCDLLAWAAAEQHAAAGYELAREIGTILFEYETAALLASLAIESNDLPRAEFLLGRSTGQPAGEKIAGTGNGLAAQRVVRMAHIELALARGQGDAALRMAFGVFGAIAFRHLPVLAIVTGILTLTGDPRRLRQRGVGLAVGYALLTGVTIASYTLWDKRAVSVLLIPPIVYEWGANVFRALILTPLAVPRWAEVQAEWAKNKTAALAVASLSPLAYMLVLTALAISPVSYVAPAREIGILIGVLVGARTLAEADIGRRSIAATLMVGGVIALALG